ncbi:MAG: biotin/lipoyl-containing protein [Chloroflexota bacterium]
MKYQFSVNGNSLELEASRIGQTLAVATADGQRHQVTIIEEDGTRLVLSVAGRLIEVVGQKEQEKRELWVNGRTLRYAYIDPEAEASSEYDSGSLSASIPAVVSDVLVAVGDQVDSGDKLILLESMKMIIPIQATQAGTVSEIMCAVGESVQPGTPLVTIE